MKSMVNSTGGVMVLSDAFTTAIFKQSFQKMFEKDAEGNLKMAFNATLAVQVGIVFRADLSCEIIGLRLVY